ncbi:tRNA (adenosine(37)-N6)-threonylcarbamoyltransferase complex dimerization subunit type 1 TsaB [Candidatus Peregrinibacteria bacterium]|nr:tRNA (adenosine(37)-N6)-threonylcarbamoyltransferase complex dimerization subunit type 1 TsaB [Candidatus Peregrinibacteria bacterium]
MNTLAINTALPFTEIALLHEDKPVESVSWQSNFNESEKVLPELQKIIAAHGPGIDRVFVVTGPGSFTGLRIGITIANTLAYALKKPIIGMNTFDYLSAKIGDLALAIVLRAGGGKLAIKLPGQDGHSFLEKSALSAFLADLHGLKGVVTDMRDLDKDHLALPNGVDWIGFDALPSMAQVLCDVILSTDSVDLPAHDQVKPVYLSAPHITESKKPLFT